MSDHKKKSQSVITAEKLKVNVKTHVVSNALKTRKSRQEEPQEIYKLNQIKIQGPLLASQKADSRAVQESVSFPLEYMYCPPNSPGKLLRQ